MSAMTDTKGGFLSTEDDPHNRALGSAPKPGGDDQQPQRPKDMTMQEWEKLQLLRTLRRQKAGPFEPGISVLDDATTRKKCRECGSLEVDWVWEEVFHLCVCNKCKNNLPDKYSLLTKTECKEDYLLTDRKSKPGTLRNQNAGSRDLVLTMAARQPSCETRSCCRISPSPTRTSRTGTT